MPPAPTLSYPNHHSSVKPPLGPPLIPFCNHPHSLPMYNQPAYNHNPQPHLAFHQYPPVQPVYYYNQPNPTSLVQLAQAPSPSPSPFPATSSSKTLPTVNHIPLLTSKLDLFAWDKGVTSLICTNNVFGHILEPSVYVDPTRLDLTPN